MLHRVMSYAGDIGLFGSNMFDGTPDPVDLARIVRSRVTTAADTAPPVPADTSIAVLGWLEDDWGYARITIVEAAAADSRTAGMLRKKEASVEMATPEFAITVTSRNKVASVSYAAAPGISIGCLGSGDWFMDAEDLESTTPKQRVQALAEFVDAYEFCRARYAGIAFCRQMEPLHGTSVRIMYAAKTEEVEAMAAAIADDDVCVVACTPAAAAVNALPQYEMNAMRRITLAIFLVCLSFILGYVFHDTSAA